MNDKFYNLPEEKQLLIINAAYKVFAKNSYKKAPMSEIAEEAQISKALLFHYFHNKLELYMYLWDNAAKITEEATTLRQPFYKFANFASTLGLDLALVDTSSVLRLK